MMEDVNMNRFTKALKRIRKNVFPNDKWTKEDYEYVKTIMEALEICEKEVMKNERTRHDGAGV
jgi:hypothetical protein